MINLIAFLYGVGLSFTDTNFFKPDTSGKFIGLKNFLEILSNKEFYSVFGFTLLYTGITVFFSYVLGMVFALLLNRDIKFRNLFRGIALAPWVMASAVVALNWRWILNDQFGIVNNILMNTGLIIDGANKWQCFRYITMPLQQPVTQVVLTLQFIWTFNSSSYDNIYLLTEGGPVNATYVLSIETYYAAFYRGKIGYAAAEALMMALFFVIAFLIYKLIKRVRNRRNAFKDNDRFLFNLGIFPQEPTLRNFEFVMEKANFSKYMINSLVAGGIVTVACLVCGCFAGYALSRYRGKGFDLFKGTTYAFQVIPSVFLLMPLYMIVRMLGLYNSLWSIVVLKF